MQEDGRTGLGKLGQIWLNCKQRKAPVPASRPVMMALATAIC